MSGYNSTLDDTFGGCIRKRTAPMRVGMKRSSGGGDDLKPAPIRKIIEIPAAPLRKNKRRDPTDVPTKARMATKKSNRPNGKRKCGKTNDRAAASSSPSSASSSSASDSTCICGRHNGDDWIGCNGIGCEAVWFHLGCVGLCEADLVHMERYYCYRCRR